MIAPNIPSEEHEKQVHDFKSFKTFDRGLDTFYNQKNKNPAKKIHLKNTHDS